MRAPGPNARAFTTGARRRCFDLLGALWAIAVFIGALAYACYFHLVAQVLPIDDAYIHFRYVENLVAGRGLVYNVGERVMGSTSPLFLGWLTALRMLWPGKDLPTLAVRANAFWYLATMATMAGLLQTLTGRWRLALVLAALAGLSLEMLTISTGAMESFLWCALALGALWADGRGQHRISGTFAGLCALARPEGLIPLGLWGVRWLIARRRRDWLAAGMAIGPLLAWSLFAAFYFGTPVPHSLLSKASGLYPMPWYYVPAVLISLMHSWTWGASWVAREWFGILDASVAIGVACLLPVRGLPADSMRRWSVGPVLVLLALLYVAGHTLVMDWYHPLFWALWYPTLFGGLALLWEGVSSEQAEPEHRRASQAALGLVFLAALTLGPVQSAVTLAHIERPTISSADRPRILSYRAAAEWLNVRAAPSDVLAAPEIGALGYYYRGKVLDACGLVSEEAMPYLPVPLSERLSASFGAIGNALVQAFQPEYVATMQGFAAPSLLVSPWFADHYALVHEVPLPAPLWNSTSVLIFARRDIAGR